MAPPRSVNWSTGRWSRTSRPWPVRAGARARRAPSRAGRAPVGLARWEPPRPAIASRLGAREGAVRDTGRPAPLMSVNWSTGRWSRTSRPWPVRAGARARRAPSRAGRAPVGLARWEPPRPAIASRLGAREGAVRDTGRPAPLMSLHRVGLRSSSTHVMFPATMASRPPSSARAPSTDKTQSGPCYESRARPMPHVGEATRPWRAVVTPTVFPRLAESLHFDIQRSTGLTRRPNRSVPRQRLV